MEKDHVTQFMSIHGNKFATENHPMIKRRIEALPDERLSGVGDAVARHVANALGRDPKRVGGNRHLAERGHEGGADHLRAGHDDMLHAHG